VSCALGAPADIDALPLCPAFAVLTDDADDRCLPLCLSAFFASAVLRILRSSVHAVVRSLGWVCEARLVLRLTMRLSVLVGLSDLVETEDHISVRFNLYVLVRAAVGWWTRACLGECAGWILIGITFAIVSEPLPSLGLVLCGRMGAACISNRRKSTLFFSLTALLVLVSISAMTAGFCLSTAMLLRMPEEKIRDLEKMGGAMRGMRLPLLI